MKGKIVTILLILVFIAGLSFMLYPTIADFYNSYLQSQIIVEYSQQIDDLEEETYKKILEKANLYNASLLERDYGFSLLPEQEKQYWNMLDTTGNGIIAYVEIPSINVTLPIGHGTEKDVLLDSVGHLKWSSLPVGGESTHCVLSGHRGLPSSELFTNIDHLVEGDIFYIHVLGQTLEYRVDNIAVVLPLDYSLLGIQEGKDYVTLLTCTPYGINSHRLLVRGVRTSTVEYTTPQALNVNNEVNVVSLKLIIPIGLALLAAAVFATVVIISRHVNKKGGGKYARKDN